MNRLLNLDHGTDFRTTVAGMPVNMPTHGHGQGYTDLGFLIPELVSSVAYKKGTYYAEEGDFSAAGAARLDYFSQLPGTLINFTVGEDNFLRLMAGDSFRLGNGDLLLAGEALQLDGPWVLPENGEKYNALAGYTLPAMGGQINVTAMLYRNRWRSTDQIARRAVTSGMVDRFGSLDDSTGGETARDSLSLSYEQGNQEQRITASAWVMDYSLNLFSNFTYFASGPGGDQFEQEDSRRAGGVRLEYEHHGELLGYHLHHHLGGELRRDVIDSVGLFSSARRTRTGTVRQDSVRLDNYSAFYSATAQWLPWLRSTLGARADSQRANVSAGLAANGGKADETLYSPKLSLQFTPFSNTELYLNAGRGFHSNDARGSTIRVDPADGVTPVNRVNLLVPARGAEAGVKVSPLNHWQLTATYWALNIDSELVFVGDAGTTSANRPSRRSGLELSSYYTPLPGVILDVDAAFSRARFADNDPAGDRIPGSIARTVSAGLVVNDYRKFFGGLRLRYFGPRPLLENNTVQSSGSTLVNLRGGYAFTRRFSAALEAFNLFDREVSDIDYFYESQLAGEAAPAEDIHFHPAEPLTLRLTLSARF